jgi:predicted nucleic acid-binding protein
LTLLVVDASIAASWMLDDEDDARAEAALDVLENTEGLVPSIWQFEMRNLLLTAVRRTRMSLDDAVARAASLSGLRLRTDSDPDLTATFRLAERHRLTFYDALYVELAKRRQAALATADRRLHAAARAEGVAWD